MGKGNVMTTDDRARTNILEFKLKPRGRNTPPGVPNADLLYLVAEFAAYQCTHGSGRGRETHHDA